MKIAIYGSKRQEGEPIAYIDKFLNELKVCGIKSIMHSKLYRYLCSVAPKTAAFADEVVEDSFFDADLAISLGGDGTFLRTAAWVADKEIPIVGVNTGHLGYLAALKVEELPELIKLIEADVLKIERRIVLQVVAENLPDYAWPFALNEAVVSKIENASMISAKVAVNKEDLGVYRADGLIISTPTGSTAYNLSVGGPVVQPTVDVFVIAPVAAHSLSMRPMVVDAASTIAISTSGRSEHVRLTLDGRCYTLPTGCVLEFVSASFQILTLQRKGSFAGALKDKLHWGEA